MKDEWHVEARGKRCEALESTLSTDSHSDETAAEGQVAVPGKRCGALHAGEKN